MQVTHIQLWRYLREVKGLRYRTCKYVSSRHNSEESRLER